MRIVYVSNARIPGTTAHSIHIMRMCSAFAHAGHTVTLLFQKKEEVSAENIFAAYGLPNNFTLVGVPIASESLGFLRYLLRIRRAVRTIDTDMVYGRYLFACLYAAWCGIPTTYESHFPVWEKGWVSTVAFWFLVRLRAFRALIVISDALRHTYIQKKLLPPERIIVAHDAAFTAREGREAPLSRGTLTVGFVGNLYEGKGMELIVRIAVRAPDMMFHIVGGQPRDIERWKKEAPANIHFHGFIPPEGVGEYIRAFDVCLLPIQETVRPHGSHTINIAPYTSPLKLFEYMAHGKTIVASDMPVIREVIDDSCSVLVNHADPDEWVRALRALTPEKRAALGEAARRRFLAAYTWEQRAARVLNAFS